MLGFFRAKYGKASHHRCRRKATARSSAWLAKTPQCFAGHRRPVGLESLCVKRPLSADIIFLWSINQREPLRVARRLPLRCRLLCNVGVGAIRCGVDRKEKRSQCRPRGRAAHALRRHSTAVRFFLFSPSFSVSSSSSSPFSSFFFGAQKARSSFGHAARARAS